MKKISLLCFFFWGIFALSLFGTSKTALLADPSLASQTAELASLVGLDKLTTQTASAASGFTYKGRSSYMYYGNGDEGTATSYFYLSYDGADYTGMCITALRGDPSSLTGKVVKATSTTTSKKLTKLLACGLEDPTLKSKCHYSEWTSAMNELGVSGSDSQKRFILAHVLAGQLAEGLSTVANYNSNELGIMNCEGTYHKFFGIKNDCDYDSMQSLLNNITGTSWISDDDIKDYKFGFAYPSADYDQTIAWIIPPKPEPEGCTSCCSPCECVTCETQTTTHTAKVYPLTDLTPTGSYTSSSYNGYQLYTFKTAGTQYINFRHAISRANTKGSSGTPFRTRTRHRVGSTWSSWDGKKNRTISGTSVGASLIWDEIEAGISHTGSKITRLSVSVSNNDSPQVVSAATRSWNTQFENNNYTTPTKYVGRQTATATIYVQGPRTTTIDVDGGVTISVKENDADGGGTLTCSQNNHNCHYYAVSNIRTFKVNAAYELSRGNDDGPSSLSVRQGTIYKNDGTHPTPTLGNAASVKSVPKNNSTTWNHGEQTVTISSYGGAQTVCFTLRYQSSFTINVTNGGTTDGTPSTSTQYSCVTIHAPERTTVSFDMTGLTSAIDSSMTDQPDETKDSVTYKVYKGDGLHSNFDIYRGQFKIVRTDTNDLPVNARANYMSKYATGLYNASTFPIFNASSRPKNTTGNLKKSGSTGDADKTGVLYADTYASHPGTDHVINVPIRTEASSKFSYTACNYGEYDNSVVYISWWDSTSGGTGRTSGAGDRTYNGKKKVCYAFYNPAAEFTATFSGTTTGTIKAAHSDGTAYNPALVLNASNTVGQVINSARISSGDDQGRYENLFDKSGKTSEFYEAHFVHTISLTSTIPNWMTPGTGNDGTPYKSIITRYRIQTSTDGKALTNSSKSWSNLTDWTSTATFSSSNTARSTDNDPAIATFSSTGTPKWGLGKYIHYCQRVVYVKESTFKTKDGQIAYDKHYDIDDGTISATGTSFTASQLAYSTGACVTLKNPKWVEADHAISHKITARGFADFVGINYPDSGHTYDTGTADTRQATVACADLSSTQRTAYQSVAGNCDSSYAQHNMLKDTATVYFGHTIRRYDNTTYKNVTGGADTYGNASQIEELFDESDSSDKAYKTNTGSTFYGKAVIAYTGSNFNTANFFPDACLKTAYNATNCVTYAGANQKNSMYYYANAGKPANQDPFALTGTLGISFAGGYQYIDGNVDTTSFTHSPILAPLTGSSWKSVGSLQAKHLGDSSAYWETSKTLGNNSDSNAVLEGLTNNKLGLTQIRAGETRRISNATATKEKEYTVRYSAITRQETYTNVTDQNGSENFDRYELRSSTPSRTTGTIYSEGQSFKVNGTNRQGQSTISLHRDWNYRITSATTSQDNNTQSNINSGGSVTTGTYSLTVKRDNDKDEVHPAETGIVGWKAIDGQDRDYITDVSGGKTKVSLVLYTVKPFEELTPSQQSTFAGGYGSSDESGSYAWAFTDMVNSHIYAPDAAGTKADGSNLENYCRLLTSNTNALKDAIGRCLDVYNVGSGSNGYSRNGGSGTTALYISPNDIQHSGDGGFSNSDTLPTAGSYGKVTTATSYTITVNTNNNPVKAFSDLTTGTKFCVAIAIQGISSTSNSILLSESTCSNVTKNPQFTVYGGDVASNGGIRTTFIEADKLYGSWGDFGLIAKKEINAMSSGRGIADGYAGDYTPATPLNGNNTVRSALSPMTLANRGNSNDKKGYVGNTVSGLNINQQTATGVGLADRFNNAENADICTFDPGNALTQDAIIAKFNDSSCTGKNRILIKHGGELKIETSINMEEIPQTQTTGLTSIHTIPQIIIIADNIQIKEDVERVDAWLATNGNFNTCGYKTEGGANITLTVSQDAASTSRNISKYDCIKQLKINGPVISSKSFFRRTYGGDPNDNINYADGGAAAGATQNTAPEVSESIDQNPGAMLFSISEASDNPPRTTYLRELAPRY